MGEHSDSELKAEIQKLKSYVKVDKVAKIPNWTRMFKILLEDAHSVDAILKKGLKAFSYRISPSQITRDPNPVGQLLQLLCNKAFRHVEIYSS